MNQTINIGNITLEAWATSCRVEDTGETIACDDAAHEYRNHALQNLATLGDNPTQEEIDQNLICPINHDFMYFPVITPGGITYERSAIERWINEQHRDPLLMNNLEVNQLRTNNRISQIIALIHPRDFTQAPDFTQTPFEQIFSRFVTRIGKLCELDQQLVARHDDHLKRGIEESSNGHIGDSTAHTSTAMSTAFTLPFTRTSSAVTSAGHTATSFVESTSSTTSKLDETNQTATEQTVIEAEDVAPADALPANAPAENNDVGSINQENNEQGNTDTADIDLENNNPVEISNIADSNTHTDSEDVGESYYSPITKCDNRKKPTAYLVDAASGAGRLFGGHAYLLIEGMRNNTYMIERTEIFAVKSEQNNLLRFFYNNDFGLVSGIKHKSLFVNFADQEINQSHIDTHFNPIPQDPEKKKAFNDNMLRVAGTCKNYVSYELDNKIFDEIRLNIRLEQIKFAKSFAKAIKNIKYNDALRTELNERISENQKSFLAKVFSSPRHLNIEPLYQLFFHSERLLNELDNMPNTAATIEEIETYHQKACDFINLVTHKRFRSSLQADKSSDTPEPDLFMPLFFKMQHMTDPQNKASLLPDDFLRFSITGPNKNFMGSAESNDPVNCLAWAKGILEKSNLKVVDHNKPKKLGMDFCQTS